MVVRTKRESSKCESNKPVAPANLWERLDAVTSAAGVYLDKPVDAFTATDYAREKRLETSCARHRLSAMVDKGLLECGGTSRKWYRLKEKV